MIETQPLDRPDRGHAEEKAKSILDGYFAEQEEAPDREEQESAAPVDSMAAQHPEPTEPDRAAPTEGEGQGEGAMEGGSEPVQEYTITDLASHFDVDPGALYAAQIPMDDGTKVPLGEMKNEWQNARRALAQVEHEKAQIQQAQAQLQHQQQELQAKQGIMQLQPDEEEQRLYSDLIAYQRAEQDQAYWDQQARANPAETALAMQRLQAQKRDTEQKLQAKQQTRMTQQQEKQRELLSMAQREISQRIPDWSDQQKVRQDWTDIQSLWSRFGMDQSAIETLWHSPPAMHLSHTFLKLLRKLEGADPGKKKVVPIKGLKTGKRASDTKKPNPQLEALTKAAKKGNRRAQEKLGADILKDFL